MQKSNFGFKYLQYLFYLSLLSYYMFMIQSCENTSSDAVSISKSDSSLSDQYGIDNIQGEYDISNEFGYGRIFVKSDNKYSLEFITHDMKYSHHGIWDAHIIEMTNDTIVIFKEWIWYFPVCNEINIGDTILQEFKFREENLILFQESNLECEQHKFPRSTTSWSQ